MKKVITLVLVILTAISIQAQDFQKMATIEMKTLSDFEQNESNALLCSEYLLNNKIDAGDENRKLATKFMMRWMEGTGITFELGKDFLKYSDGDYNRTQVYLASIVFAALKSETKLGSNDINTKAAEIFLNYCLKFKSLKRNKAIKKELKKYESQN